MIDVKNANSRGRKVDQSLCRVGKGSDESLGSVAFSGEGKTPKAALGSEKNVATTLEKGRSRGLSKWQLKRGAMKLLSGWSVCSCMHATVDGISTVTGMYIPATSSGVVVGVKRCKSATTCPVCCSQITEVKRKELQEAVDTWRAQGGRVFLCTYTFKHHEKMTLKWMINRLNEAFRAMKKGGSYDRLLKKMGMNEVYGTVAAREVKHGMKNGWHPHIHELVFVRGDVDAKELEAELRKRWEKAAAAQGLSMNQHGFQLDDCDEHVAEYLAKYDKEPAWTEIEEVTKGHLKQNGIGEKREEKEHYTPFQLLRFAMEGDEEAGKLFVEYAEAMKGRALIRWKPGFRAALGLTVEKTEEECIDDHEQEGVVMVSLDAKEEWPVIVANDAVGEFVNCLATGDIQVVCEFLEALGIYRDAGMEPEVINLKEWKMQRRKKAG